MKLEIGSTVEFTYTDKSGETRKWKGEVRRAKEEYFALMTDEGYRNFRYENIEGEVRVQTRA